MRRITLIAYILSAVLLIFAFSTFSDPVEETIEGLVFLFYPESLPLTLPGISINVVYVEVEASGREQITIAPSGQYNYSANLTNGIIHAYESVTVCTDDEGNIIGIEPDSDPVNIVMESGSLNEHFSIEGPIPDDPLEVEVPDDVDLYFKATLIIDGETFNYQLKIKNGQVKFIKP